MTPLELEKKNENTSAETCDIEETKDDKLLPNDGSPKLVQALSEKMKD